MILVATYCKTTWQNYAQTNIFGLKTGENSLLDGHIPTSTLILRASFGFGTFFVEREVSHKCTHPITASKRLLRPFWHIDGINQLRYFPTSSNSGESIYIPATAMAAMSQKTTEQRWTVFEMQIFKICTWNTLSSLYLITYWGTFSQLLLNSEKWIFQIQF